MAISIDRLRTLINSPEFELYQEYLDNEIQECINALTENPTEVIEANPDKAIALLEKKFDFYTVLRMVLGIVKRMKEEPVNILKEIIMSVDNNIWYNADGSSPKVLTELKELLHWLEKRNEHGSGWTA